MKLAAFSDAHANIHALQAILKDIERRGPDYVVCLGDLVGYGVFPGEVINEIKGRGIPTVTGNYDDAIGNGRMVCGCDYPDEKAARLGAKSISWTTENTPDNAKEFLRELPRRVDFNIKGHNVACFHGSPRKLNEYLFEDFPEKELLHMIEEAGCDVLLCGHTHLPYYRVLGNKHVINAGSVGKPKHGDPSAVYALLDIDSRVNVEFIKVPYNYEEAARAIESAGLPKEFARAVRTGKP